MTTFVWYNENSKESGELLAQLIGAEGSGKLPPENFSGVLVSYGARPGDKFKWSGGRNIRAVLNDPRKKVLASDLPKLLAAVKSDLRVAADPPPQNFDVARERLGEANEFVMCKPSGAGGRTVHNQAEFAEAITAGCTVAVDRRFLADGRQRGFVLGGAILGALRRAVPEADVLVEKLAGEPAGEALRANAALKTALAQLLAANLVAGAKQYWVATASPAPASPLSIKILTAAGASGLDFCAVDYLVTAGNVTILNVIGTPELVGHTTIHASLSSALRTWVTKHTKTPKEVLQEIIAGANEEEAAVLLEALRAAKAG